MLTQVIEFNNNINASLQVGDIIYYSPTQTVPTSGFNTVNSPGTIVLFGIVTDIYDNGNTALGINPYSIVVIYDDITVAPPALGDYIMFTKNKEVNSSSLKGYFAKVKFVNYSTDKVELFAVNSEISESSK